jgi:hypothetical protein
MAQHNEAKEEKREKDCRYRHGAYGRGLRDSIRKKNVARGFDPRGHPFYKAPDLGHMLRRLVESPDLKESLEMLGITLPQAAPRLPYQGTSA